MPRVKPLTFDRLALVGWRELCNLAGGLGAYFSAGHHVLQFGDAAGQDFLGPLHGGNRDVQHGGGLGLGN